MAGKDAVHERRNSLTSPPDAEFAPDEMPAVLGSHVPVVRGRWDALPPAAQDFVAQYVKLCTPKAVYLCDGSQDEAKELTQKLVKRGMLHPLEKMQNCYLCRTDPADVARVESRTFIVTDDKYDSVPHVAEGEVGILGLWMSRQQAEKEMGERFPGAMRGRNMYVIPFSMGPVGSGLSKVGVQVTDCSYVVISMHIMAHVTEKVWEFVRNGSEFVKCVHTIGVPRPVEKEVINHWPCNPERILICHYPDERLIMSFGSGYGGNSLLGKKCFALRIASRLAKEEGWLAEHMLLMSVTNPKGEEKFIAAAFPSACGKTNLSMLQPTLPGWKINCIGDDIAWMRFDSEGRLRAINPEAGFFGVAPGTNRRTNPVAVDTYQKNTIFTNTAATDDGEVYWEGMEKEIDSKMGITTWLGQRNWHIGDKGPAAHPNSRFCCQACQCPVIHPHWERPEGVPVDAIIFGGRRPAGVPLVMEALNWKHGVMMGATLKSEATAAAEHKGKTIMHDPMAMRPFIGYNFGKYLQHWVDLEQDGRKLPKIFHVNWFRLNEQGKFLWPGFGENIRVLDWICRRIDGEDIAEPSPVGLVPKLGSLNIDGLGDINMEELMSVPKEYWLDDMKEGLTFLEKQLGCDLSEDIRAEIKKQMERIQKIPA